MSTVSIISSSNRNENTISGTALAVVVLVVASLSLVKLSLVKLASTEIWLALAISIRILYSTYI